MVVSREATDQKEHVCTVYHAITRCYSHLTKSLTSLTPHIITHHISPLVSDPFLIWPVSYPFLSCLSPASYSGCFWPVSDLFLTRFWPVPDLFLTYFWAVSDPFLTVAVSDPFLTCFDPSLTCFGPVSDSMCEHSMCEHSMCSTMCEHYVWALYVWALYV